MLNFISLKDFKNTLRDKANNGFTNSLYYRHIYNNTRDGNVQ